MFRRLRPSLSTPPGLVGLGLALLLAAQPAWARLGGGQSFSGGSHSSGGGYSGGGSSDGGGLFSLLFQLLLELCFDYPVVGIPVVLGLVALVCYALMTAPATSTYSTDNQWSRSDLARPRRKLDLQPLRQADPNFSRPIFLDFVNLLYTRVRLESAHPMQDLVAYLQADVLEIVRKQTGAIDQVIVGSIQITEVRVTPSISTVELRFETNLRANGQSLYCVESWTLQRKTGVLSKNPDEALKLACPSCGNPGEMNRDGTCPFCGKLVNTGNFGWLVVSIKVVSQEPTASIDLSWDGSEAGTELPTVVDPELDLQRKSFEARDPSFQWSEFEQRVKVMFLNLQNAWSDRQLEQIRPFETDSLFSSHRYWIEAYLQQHLINRLDEVKVNTIQPVRFEPDAFYESITVRIWAQMKDSTTDEKGKVVGGSASRLRQFSEYWTFVRRIGAHKSGDYAIDRCPSCGAPLDKIGMSGICGYCDSKVTRGDFDWVLSLIEQDEVYTG